MRIGWRTALVLLGLSACKAGSTEPLSTGIVIPTDLPTDPQEDPSVAGIVAAHNLVRQGVGIPDLIWDDDLAAFATHHVDYLNREKGCDLIHSVRAPYGENLFWSSVPTDAREVVDSWASEVEDYDYTSNRCDAGKACGHYTQIVWEDTERVGCAKLTCDFGNGQVWSCNYDPPGNWVGEWPY